MKKTLLICLIAITALVSCKKDNNAEATKKLVGKWMATKEIEKEFQNGTLQSTDVDTYGVDEFVIEFTSSELKVYDDGDLEDTYPYTVSGNVISYKEDGKQKSMNLQWNNDNEIVLVQEESDTSNNITYREVLETTFVRK